MAAYGREAVYLLRREQDPSMGFFATILGTGSLGRGGKG